MLSYTNSIDLFIFFDLTLLVNLIFDLKVYREIQKPFYNPFD